MSSQAWQRLILVIAVVTVVNPLLVLLTINLDRSGRTRISAESQLQNCQGVQNLNGKILQTVNESAKGRRLTPRQQKALAQLRARFAVQNCYALPIVKSAGIKPPPPKHH